MKTGLCSVTFRDHSLEDVVQLTKEAGLEAIEWEAKVHVPHEDFKAARKAARLTKEAGLSVSSYGSYYIAGSVEPFQGILRTAQELNTKMIRIWAGDAGSDELDDAQFDRLVRDVKLNAHLAQNLGITLSFEYHSNTLTDTPGSAVRLLEAIDEPNVKLYWQPAESLTFGQRIASLPLLKPWLTNVHVFHWQDYHTRYTLEEGSEEWTNYYQHLTPFTSPESYALLEFVKGNSPEQMKRDAEVLKRLVQRQ